MTLYEVALIFDEIEKISSRLAITEKLASLYKKASAQEAQIISYLVLGSLFPPYKAVELQIADKTMMAILARVCNVSEDEIKSQYKKIGDLGLVVCEYAQQNSGTISIQDLHDLLISYTTITGSGSIELKIEKCTELLQQVDTLSAKYIVRIITKTLRLGFSDMTVLDALSYMYAHDKSLKKPLEDAYNVCADLGLVAYILKEQGVDGILKVTPHVGIPIRPAAAERLASTKEILEKLGPCAVQPKLDGFRLQIHMQKKSGSAEIAFFSRNLVDMSAMFPDIKKVIQELPVDSLICEGEAIAYNQETGEFLPFQETVKRRRKHDIEQMSEDMPLRFYMFDILYVNGKSVMNMSHLERRALLEKTFAHATNDLLFIIEEHIMKNAQELEKYFFQCMTSGLEGIVAKRLDALYQPGKRNFNWIKLKRHEKHSIVEDTIDAVILGYYTGQGKRAGFGIGAFLVGIYNETKQVFQTIAKVGTGLTDQEWIEIRTKCDALQVVHAPKNVQVPKELQPDVWVHPEIVCEIRCDNITKSPLHTAGKHENHDLGYALRFPRFLGYRKDKSAFQATTIEELIHLYDQQFVAKEQ